MDAKWFLEEYARGVVRALALSYRAGLGPASRKSRIDYARLRCPDARNNHSWWCTCFVRKRKEQELTEAEDAVVVELLEEGDRMTALMRETWRLLSPDDRQAVAQAFDFFRETVSWALYGVGKSAPRVLRGIRRSNDRLAAQLQAETH